MLILVLCLQELGVGKCCLVCDIRMHRYLTTQFECYFSFEL